MKRYPTDIFEPTVVFEAREFAIVAVVRVEGQEGLNEFFGPAIFKCPLKDNIALNNLLINLIWILGVGPKWQLTKHKLIEHNP